MRGSNSRRSKAPQPSPPPRGRRASALQGTLHGERPNKPKSLHQLRLMPDHVRHRTARLGRAHLRRCHGFAWRCASRESAGDDMRRFQLLKEKPGPIWTGQEPSPRAWPIRNGRHRRWKPSRRGVLRQGARERQEARGRVPHRLRADAPLEPLASRLRGHPRTRLAVRRINWE